MNIKGFLKMNRQQRTVYFIKKLKLHRFLNFQIKAQFADKTYTIPLANNIGLRNLKYNTEPWMKDTIRRLLSLKKGIFMDIGANIGQTLMKLRSVSTVPYIGFEPNPESVVYLERLIQANKMEDCTICPVGLSNRNGLVLLYTSFAGSPYSTIVKGYNAKHNLNRTRVVSVFRGDEIIPEVCPADEIAVIKIDVEGAELDVIEGLQATLKKHRPCIIVEIVPVVDLELPNSKARQERIERLLALIKTNDYEIFGLDQAKQGFEPVTQIEAGKVHPVINYVLIPVECGKRLYVQASMIVYCLDKAVHFLKW